MIELRNICKTFEGAGGKVDALHNINLTISDGDIYGIIGMSGAGKSTLVRCINMLERPTEGEVIVDGVNMGELSPSQLREARRGITMIFQCFNLLMQKNCLKNVCFPMELAGIPKADAVKRATELLELVGLPDKAKAYPAQLSGGQQQRVAIARALATNPKLLLLDEPAAGMNPQETDELTAFIKKIRDDFKLTVFVIEHHMNLVMDISDRIYVIDFGKLIAKGTPAEVQKNQRVIDAYLGVTDDE